MPKKLDQISLIIDFDSTLTQVEGLDELANIALANNPNRAEIVAEIRHLTELGMAGELSFSQSLSRRIALLQANRGHLDLLIEFLKTQISASFLRNRDFLAANAAQIFILSGGFKEFIVPVAALLGLREENVFANTFVFDEAGNIGGVDENNFLAGDYGKVKTIKSLDLAGEIYIIGDGFTDYELRASGLASRFYAFTENVSRPQVTAVADKIISSFDEFLAEIS